MRKNGKTGYPIVDASMRCLVQTGFLNFRMRALIVSFLTHHLWIAWQEGAVFLAKNFLDFEPEFIIHKFKCKLVRPV